MSTAPKTGFLFLPLSTDDALPSLDAGELLIEGNPIVCLKRTHALDALQNPPFVMPGVDPGDGSPVPPPTVVDAGILILLLPADQLALLLADGSILATSQPDQYEVFDIDAVKAAITKVLFEAKPQNDHMDGTTLFAVFCQAQRHPTTGASQHGGHSLALTMATRQPEMFEAGCGLRLFGSRADALNSLKKVGEDDEVAIVRVLVPTAGFRVLIATSQRFRTGYQVPVPLLPLVQEQSIMTIELVRHDELKK